jgi:integration host factor subunit alpha
MGGEAMAGNTVTRAQLGEAVYQEVGLSRNESGDLVEAVLKEISDALVANESVKVSSFGSFSIRSKGERVGRNPKTGEEVPILPRKVLVFRASHVLKGRINDALSKPDGAKPADNVAPATPQGPDQGPGSRF